MVLSSPIPLTTVEAAPMSAIPQRPACAPNSPDGQPARRRTRHDEICCQAAVALQRILDQPAADRDAGETLKLFLTTAEAGRLLEYFLRAAPAFGVPRYDARDAVQEVILYLVRRVS